jgi:hypothetical protein
MRALNLRSTIGCALFSCVVLARLSTANVLVVDASGGGDYTQIQAAIDAAVDGDTILVKPGLYSACAILNKAIAIVGDSGGLVEINSTIDVLGLYFAKTIVLEHLNVTTSSASINALRLSNLAGHVRIDSCEFTVGAVASGAGADAIVLHLCADVALSHVTSVGGSGDVGFHYGFGYPSGAGLSADHSSVVVYGSTLRGGTGVSADPNAGGIGGGMGGDACVLSSSSMFAAGSSFSGGNGGGGGYGIPFADVYGGDGGDGISSTASRSWLLESATLPGIGGAPGVGDGSKSGDNGSPRSGATFIRLAGSWRRMHVPTPVREDASYQFTFTGLPGEQVALVVSNEASHVLDLPWKGVLLTKTMHPLLSIPMGTIPEGGTLSVSSTALDLGGLPSKLLHVQPVFIDSQGHHTLGNASSVVILSHLY